MTEQERDPLDLAADEAADVMGEREKMPWSDFIEMLQHRAETSARRLGIAQRLQAAFAAEGGQLPLIPDAVPEPKRPRAPRRILMHAGELAGSFECPKCHETAPIPEDISDVARKRGIPCPKCNAETEQKVEGAA